MTILRPAAPALIGAALLFGAAPAEAQSCGLALAAGPGPGANVCSELAGTSSSTSLWGLSGLASQPSAYDAFLDAIVRIPRTEGLRGWAAAEAGATIVSPSLGRVSLLSDAGVVGLARLDLPAAALDYFRSDTLADSLYWSFEGVNLLGVTFRFAGGGALLEISDRFTVGATVRFLQARELVGGRVSGGMLESFDGLDMDMQVREYGHVHGSGTTFGFLAVMTGDEFRATLIVEQLGAPSRLTVQSHVREVDSTHRSTDEAVAALGPSKGPVRETVELRWPARVRFALGHEVGRRTWLQVDSDVILTRGFSGANRVGARLRVRPLSWMHLEAGGGWSSGIDGSVGVGLSVGRLTWTLGGRSALSGRHVRLATGVALH